MTTARGSRRRVSARGEHRKQQLLEAAGDVLMEHGFAALSHRSVAQRADLPLSATTYYFTSLDELLEGAVRHVARSWLTSARDVVASLPPTLSSPEQLAAALLQVATLGTAEHGSAVTLYDRYLEAARHPGLRPVIAGYDEEMQALVVEVLHRGGVTASTLTARLVLAVVDGALLRALAEGAALSSAGAPLVHLIGWLAPPQA